MKLKRKSNIAGILLIILTSVFATSCNKDDNYSEPSDAITLNMLNEQNGKTMLGESDVFINKSINFCTNSCLIADAGSASGVGANIAPLLENLTSEAAAIPGHLYQIFDKNTIRVFPSGKKAVIAEVGYYKAYVTSLITEEKATTGAVVRYYLVSPKLSNLPEPDHNIGNLNSIGDKIEIKLPKDAECFFKNTLNDEGYEQFLLSVDNRKLIITLNAEPNENYGPYGTYRVYIRSGSIYTTITFDVGVVRSN